MSLSGIVHGGVHKITWRTDLVIMDKIKYLRPSNVPPDMNLVVSNIVWDYNLNICTVLYKLKYLDFILANSV